MEKTVIKAKKADYKNEELVFVCDEIIKLLNKGLRITMSDKRSLIKSFFDIYGEEHTFDSIKLLIDNFMANFSLNGYKKFGKGSLEVQRISKIKKASIDTSCLNINYS